MDTPHPPGKWLITGSKYVCMPKSLLLLTSMLLLLSTGCRDKEEEVFLTESDVLGTWLVSEFDNDYQISGTFGGEPLNEQGQSRISESDLQLIFLDNGRWQSTGTFVGTVTTEKEQQVREYEGVGSGTWSFSRDTLYVSGLRTYNETGYFAERQPFTLSSFEKERSLDFTTLLDATESEPSFGIEMRTRANYTLSLIR